MNKSIQFVKFTTTLNAYDCLDELAEEHYKWTEQKLKNYAYKRLKCRFHYLEQYPGLQFGACSTHCHYDDLKFKFHHADPDGYAGKGKPR